MVSIGHHALRVQNAFVFTWRFLSPRQSPCCSMSLNYTVLDSTYEIRHRRFMGKNGIKLFCFLVQKLFKTCVFPLIHFFPELCLRLAYFCQRSVLHSIHVVTKGRMSSSSPSALFSCPLQVHHMYPFPIHPSVDTWVDSVFYLLPKMLLGTWDHSHCFKKWFIFLWLCTQKWDGWIIWWFYFWFVEEPPYCSA